MKIGICGGTFDPLHNGHVTLVMAALDSREVDRVIVMPAGRPPHKTQELVSMARYRYEMAVRAFAHDPRIEVSDLEIKRPGPSYTLETVQELQAARLPQDELFLIYGSDVLKDISHWHEPAKLLASCTLLLANRGGYLDEESRRQAADLTAVFNAVIRFFPAPELDLSSTWLRRQAAAGQSIQAWVPPGVDRFIRKHAIYRWQADLAALDADCLLHLYDLERLLWTRLTGKRLLHSLNVMTYALHLARIHGVSLEATGIAALLHDCAKCLQDDEQRRYARLAGGEALLDPALAHGPAGAWLARTCFGVGEQAILRAIHYHTTGCAGMTPLDKIIFIADKVEPARTYDHLAEIRSLAETDLDRALLLCLQEIDLFLDREHLPSHPYTRDAYADLAGCRQSGDSLPPP